MPVPQLAPVSLDRMIRAVEKVRERLVRVVRILEDAGIPYAVTGGNAVAAWVSRVDEGAVRNTRDVDILLRRSDLPAARVALENNGFIYRRIASLGQAGHIDVFLDGPNSGAREAVHIVFAREKVRPESLVESADVTEAEHTPEFRVVTLEALVRMKLAAFRDKDRTHLRDLIEVGLLDQSWLLRVPAELRPRLQQIFETPFG